MLRKLMLLAAMLAMVLVAAAPAFAQDAVAGDQYEVAVETDISDSFNTVAECIQAVDQYADADQDNDTVVSGNAAGDDINTATSNDQEISQEAVQYCNDYVLGDVVEEEAAASSSSSAAAAEAGGSSSGSSSSGSSSSGSSSSSSELPATGGISLLTLGAGALLVGGGLVARKLVK